VEALHGMRRTRGELYELAEPPGDARLSNADLAPTPVAERTWGTYHMASLWIGLSVCIPTYMLAASLVDGRPSSPSSSET
jgi:cytosine/uracil/thiamine/allantoin permease